MQPRIRHFLPLAGLVLCGVLSCGEDPTRVGRPPVVEGFSPTDQALSVFTGDTLVFSIRAIDPDRSILRQSFTLGDSIVSAGTRWDYVVGDTGSVMVSCTVTDGEYNSRVQWVLHRQLRVNHAPAITSFSPVESNPTMIINTTLEFAVEATDEDEDDLEYSFTVNGSVAAAGDRFVYTSAVEGLRIVEAVVSDGELFAKRSWSLNVTGIPDTIPPAEVPITFLEPGVEPGEVEAEWTAVGQDVMDGTASNYLVRTSPAPVLNETDWDRASAQAVVPPPLPAGATMGMTIVGVLPGRYTHVTVRAVDDFGNLSPIGPSPGVYTRGMRMGGMVRDAVTLETIPDVTVRLAHYTTQTGASGEFEFIELPPIDGAFSLTDEFFTGIIGPYFNYANTYKVVHEDFLDLYLIPNLAMESAQYANFYSFFRSMTDVDGIPYKTQHRRWELPINLYVPPFTANGLDFRQTIADIADEFDDILGTSVFHIVDAPPESGVSIRYLSDIYADNYQVTNWTADWYQLKARIEFRTHYATATVNAFRVVIRHELGHALGLNHSVDTGHLMVGGTVPGVSTFTLEEIAVIRAHYHIPRGRQMLDYTVE
jgi:hypothetical protein